MYDYRPSRFDEETTTSTDTYCGRCGDEITQEEYEELNGHCSFCKEVIEEEEEWV